MDELDEITARIEAKLKEQGFDEIKTAVAALNQAVGRLAARQTHTEKLLVLMHKRLQKIEVTDDKVDRALGFLGDLKMMLQVLTRDRDDGGARNMSEVSELDERVTRVETILEQDSEQRKERQADLDKTLTDIQISIKDVHAEIQRYKGFTGGVALAVSVIWAGVIAFKDAIGKLFR